MRKLVILVTVITIGLFLISCGNSTPTTPATPPPAATTPAVPPPAATTPAASEIDAKTLYAANCAMCHGQNRQGMPNLAPALTPATLGNDSDTDIKSIITNGRSGTAMAGFGTRLKPADIDALARFVKNVAP